MDDAAVSALEADIGVWTSTFRLVTPRGEAAVELALPGRFNVANALCAAACAAFFFPTSTSTVHAEP